MLIVKVLICKIKIFDMIDCRIQISDTILQSPKLLSKITDDVKQKIQVSVTKSGGVLHLLQMSSTATDLRSIGIPFFIPLKL